MSSSEVAMTRPVKSLSKRTEEHPCDPADWLPKRANSERAVFSLLLRVFLYANLA